MTRTSLDHHNCSLARTAEVIGDKWALMIIRDAFYGYRRFRDFKERLGITQAVLSDRLARLVEQGILERHELGEGARQDYGLTAKGRDLFAVLVALVQWGDRWIHDGKPPVDILDAMHGKPVQLRVSDAEGKPLKLREVVLKAGPGANDATRALPSAAPKPAKSP
jgi:DNA-binding HxlR family transcriptional regulator